MRKLKIALFVVSLAFVVILGALVIGNNFNIEVKAGEGTAITALGDFALGYIPFVRDHKWIVYVVAEVLLIAFAGTAGFTLTALKKRKKTRAAAGKKSGGKTPVQPVKAKVNF